MKSSLAKYFSVEVILISEFMNLELRITSTTFRPFSQSGRLPAFHFEKPLMSCVVNKGKVPNIKNNNTDLFSCKEYNVYYIYHIPLHVINTVGFTESVIL